MGFGVISCHGWVICENPAMPCENPADPSRSRAVPSRSRPVPTCPRAVPSRPRAVPPRSRPVPTRPRAVPPRSRPVPTCLPRLPGGPCFLYDRWTIRERRRHGASCVMRRNHFAPQTHPIAPRNATVPRRSSDVRLGFAKP